MKIQIPKLPPSVNELWHRSKHPKVEGNKKIYPIFKDARAVEFEQIVSDVWRVSHCEPVVGNDVAVTVVFTRKRRAGDIDNKLKVLFDSFNRLAWADDRQLKALHIYLDDGKKELTDFHYSTNDGLYDLLRRINVIVASDLDEETSVAQIEQAVEAYKNGQ